VTRSGSKLPSNSSRLLRRRKQRMRSARIAIAAIPPTTPPTIAPVFDELFVAEEEEVETGIDVVVDISVVIMIVAPSAFVELVYWVKDCKRNEIRKDERNSEGYCSCNRCHGGCCWSGTCRCRGS
jgi:hypothetical protein